MLGVDLWLILSKHFIQHYDDGCCMLSQVELKEYVKIEDMIYEIDHKAMCPEDKLRHHRVISYKVIIWWFSWNENNKCNVTVYILLLKQQPCFLCLHACVW